MKLFNKLRYKYRVWFVAPRLDNVSWAECPYCDHKTLYDDESVMSCFYCDKPIGPDKDPRRYIANIRHWKHFLEAMGPEEVFEDEAEEVMNTLDEIIEIYNDGYWQEAKELNDLFAKMLDAEEPEEVMDNYKLRLQQRD